MRAALTTAALLASCFAAAAQDAAVHINQLGYLPQSAKWAVVPEGKATRLQVVKAGSSEEVLSVPLSKAAVWEPAQQRVSLADFSALRTPGDYEIRLEGTPGLSRFSIAANAYEAVSAAAIKAFYFNRAGIELTPKYAGAWARPAGHADTRVLVHASAASAGRPEGTVISSPKGWYDAGDYNKYIVNSGITVYTLLAAFEHFPEFFKRQSLNIPETGNGIPDLLNETLWNLDWMLSMQDPLDGGVYAKLSNKGFDGVVMPHEAKAERYVVQKTTAAALNFAAVMATASRVFKAYEAKHPGLSARMLKAAEKAWAWAEANPTVIYRQPADIHTGGYDDDKVADEFAWAAAELFITTGDPRFYKAFNAAVPATAPAGVPAWNSVSGLAWMSLAHHRKRLGATADQALIALRIKGQAEQLASAWAASPWRLSQQTADINWGSNSGLLNQAMMLIQGYRLSGERSQLDAAQAAFDYVLGRNPLGLSMVTGFGSVSPMHPHHRPSGADGVLAPVPGFLVGGPNPGQQDAKDCPLPYASKLPALSYLDHFCSYASNEVAINWNAPLVYVSAALQVLTPSAGKPPEYPYSARP
jgi:endoglucanase